MRVRVHRRPSIDQEPAGLSVDVPALALAANEGVPGSVSSGETVKRYERETRFRILEIHIPSTNL